MMDGTNIVTAIVQILTSGLVQTGTGIGSGLNSMITSLMLDTTGTTPVLSQFAQIAISFMAVGLALGVMRLIIKFVTSMGKTRRM